jgi:hypothetical protein
LIISACSDQSARGVLADAVDIAVI